jgi:ERCC4-type nuclease
MEKFTVIVDSREKLPYEFKDYPVNVETDKLDTGDYTIKGYRDYLAIERKTKEDFLSSISQNRDRFQNELKRARKFVKPMEIVVEEPERTFKLSSGNSFDNTFSNIHPNAVKGTINKWDNYFNIDFQFVEGRPEGEELTYETLKDFYEIMSLIE